MFISEKLVYLELQKTGSKQIRHLLSQCVPGEQKGKHVRLTEHPSNRLIVGSIRNPWAWYVSLWAFGCMGRGHLRRRLVERSSSWMESFINLVVPAAQEGSIAQHSLLKSMRPKRISHDLWAETYTDPTDTAAFKKWLCLMHDPERAGELSPGYGQSALHHGVGFFTYRYLRLYARDLSPLSTDHGLQDWQQVRDFDTQQNILDYVIRMESLEQDLVRALELAGYDISVAQRDELFSSSGAKRNRTGHYPISSYYDAETIAWVRSRERLIIEKYGYSYDDL
ncbi:MAG: hypothetical protein HOH43_24660 [Candidatus Latescibacteria bacterium]|nr:hypothetical protein [Candidatus Latescibacterota bacterium]